MVDRWPHPPGTLRAIRQIIGNHYVIRRRCRRYTDMEIPRGQEDRKYDPCPYRCIICRQRGELVTAVPEGFERIAGPNDPLAHRPAF